MKKMMLCYVELVRVIEFLIKHFNLHSNCTAFVELLLLIQSSKREIDYGLIMHCGVFKTVMPKTFSVIFDK